VKREKLLNLNRVAAYWSQITGTPRPHRGTVIRWATKGVKGVRLRAERLAGRWYASPEAVLDFHRQLTTASAAEGDRLAGPTRVIQVQAALQELDALIGT
jgi:hypothetical protein